MRIASFVFSQWTVFRQKCKYGMIFFFGDFRP